MILIHAKAKRKFIKPLAHNHTVIFRTYAVTAWAHIKIGNYLGCSESAGLGQEAGCSRVVVGDDLLLIL